MNKVAEIINNSPILYFQPECIKLEIIKAMQEYAKALNLPAENHK